MDNFPDVAHGPCIVRPGAPNAVKVIGEPNDDAGPSWPDAATATRAAAGAAFSTTAGVATGAAFSTPANARPANA